MANSDSAAVLRADLRTSVEEAVQVDKMFIGLQVFPIADSDNETGQYPKFRLGKAELLNDDVSTRGQSGSYNRIIRTYENDNYACIDRGLEELVDDRYKRTVSRFYQAEQKAAKFILRQVRLGHEVRVAAALIDTGTFTATAAAVNYTEANIATINFIRDVGDAVGRLNDKGVIPNTIVMSKNVFLRTRRSTIVSNFLRGRSGTDTQILANAQDLASLFADDGIEQCLVGRMPKNSAKKGQAFSATSVWPDTHIWVGYVASGDPMGGGAGRTFVWNQEGGIWVAESYRSEERRSDVVRVRQNTAEKVIDGTAGELVTTNYA